MRGAPMNGPRTASDAPVGHLNGLRGRLLSSGIILGLALLMVPSLSHGQQPTKVYRIGFLSGGNPPALANTTPQQCPIKGGPTWQAFVEGLREYGYLPGQNLLIECRWTGGQAEPAPALAAELVSLKPDLIVVHGLLAGVRAAQQATSTIPIVMVNITAPVGLGLVESLAHPGGNVTGLSSTAGAGIAEKQLQLLKEAAPKAASVAVLRYAGSGGYPGFSSTRFPGRPWRRRTFEHRGPLLSFPILS